MFLLVTHSGSAATRHTQTFFVTGNELFPLGWNLQTYSLVNELFTLIFLCVHTGVCIHVDVDMLQIICGGQVTVSRSGPCLPPYLKQGLPLCSPALKSPG